ncbi:hypothetical protein HGB07_08275 [Candidatus Roizmanbacteria bacterium]|nr:hypothetical protein [Candidatus Roizmanbacteria bacterium]
MSCKNCLAWDSHKKSIADDEIGFVGQCRFNPPIFTNDEVPAKWPITEHCDWCLKFVPRDALKNKISPSLLVYASMRLVALVQALRIFELVLG